jgi:hypothetical protein
LELRNAVTTPGILRFEGNPAFIFQLSYANPLPIRQSVMGGQNDVY